MSLPGSWYKSALLLTLAIALTVWACGDGGGPTEPNDPGDTGPKPVASVTVAPSTAAVDVAQTQQFTATLKDASGNTLTGRTVTWASSDGTVASVSSAGLVAALGAGEATITATSEGRSGTATVSVTQPLPPGVLGVGTIGADGGSINTPDVGLTIAAGQLSATAQIQILSSDDPMEEFGSDLASGTFRLQGFPQDRNVEVRVRLRATAPLSGQTFIGMGVPQILSSLDTDEPQRGLVLQEATDSAGYVVATMSVRGRGGSSSAPPLGMSAASGIDGLDDGLIGAVTGMKTDSVPGGKWVVLSWGAPRTELDPLVSEAVELVTHSQTTVEAMGYSVAHRTRWPMQIHVFPTNQFSGAFSRDLPWPLDVNTASLNISTQTFSQGHSPGTAIHEFFHFAQSAFTDGMSGDDEVSYRWVGEASSTWIEEKAPDAVGAFDTWLVRTQRDDLFKGLYPSLTADDGYGKAPIIKYVADRWGTAQVKKIWDNVGSGETAIDALLKAIPEPGATWWPDLLTKYMKGEIYALDPDSLPPVTGQTSIDPGNFLWGTGATLRPLGTHFIRFTPVQNGYGTGTKLTWRIPSELYTAGVRILPFRMDASGKWEAQGGVADSLVISGADLNLGRQYGVFLISTAASAPYTDSWPAEYETDIGYEDGDWYTGNVEVLYENITYDRPSATDTTTLDVAAETELIFSFIASGGVWKRTEQDDNLYIWEPTAEFSADLAEMNATASSEAEVLLGDSLRLKAVFDFNPPASAVGEPGSSAAMVGACLLLLAGLVMRRKRQLVMAAFAGSFGLFLWGCDLGSINLSLKYEYDFTFENAALTASLEDATVPLVTLENGMGIVYIDRYVSEFWEYTRDAGGNITDSVAVTRTASGDATVKLDALLIQDGVLETEDVAGMLRASGLLPGSLEAVPERFRGIIRR